MRKFDRSLLYLSAILVIATALRIFLIAKESIWFDEAFSIRLASGSLWQALTAERTNPPLHFLALHYWIRLFGNSETSTRFLSVIPSVLAILLTYLLGTSLYHKRVGLIAAGFMSISSFQIYYAQEARCFSLLLLLLTTSTYSMHRALESRDGTLSKKWWYLYLCSTVLSLYTHFFAIFFVISQNVFVALRLRTYRNHLKSWIIVQTISFLLFLPWFLQMLTAAAGGGQARRYLLLKLPQAVFSFLVGDTLVPLDEHAVRHVTETLSSYWPIVLLAMTAFGAICLIAIHAQWRNRNPLVFLTLMIVGPILISFAISFRIMIFDERYLIGVTPPLAILLASAFDNPPLSRRIGVMRNVSVSVALLLCLISLLNYYFDERFGRDQWREVTAAVVANLRNDDLIVFQPDYVDICFDYYAKRPYRKLVLVDNAEIAQSAEWAHALHTMETAERIWFVMSHVRAAHIAERLEARFTTVRRLEFPKDKGITLFLFERAERQS